jgi:hypothetical protein
MSLSPILGVGVCPASTSFLPGPTWTFRRDQEGDKLTLILICEQVRSLGRKSSVCLGEAIIRASRDIKQDVLLSSRAALKAILSSTNGTQSSSSRTNLHSQKRDTAPGVQHRLVACPDHFSYQQREFRTTGIPATAWPLPMLVVFNPPRCKQVHADQGLSSCLKGQSIRHVVHKT